MFLAALPPAAPEWAIFLAQSGTAGLMLWWFMYRVEVRLRAGELATNRLTRAQLLLVVALNQANETMKQEARSAIRDIDATLAKNSKPEVE